MELSYYSLMTISCDLVGIILILSIQVGNRILFRCHRTGKYDVIITMMISTLIACVLDALLEFLLGRSGTWVGPLIALFESLLFMSHCITAAAWIMFLQYHFDIWKVSYWKKLVYVPILIGIVLLVINIFWPIVFYVDSDNIYHRQLLYIYYYLLLIVYAVFGVLLVRHIDNDKKHLTFFQPLAFVTPILIGATLHLFIYGFPLTYPCTAISIASLLVSLQNDMLYRDQLTGLFSRYYMDAYQVIAQDSKSKMFGIMLDLNGFKQINDCFGHAEGDRALVMVANILQHALPRELVIIRYAGDEFIILDDVSEGRVNRNYEDEIRRAFQASPAVDADNSSYTLSVAIGSGIFDPSEVSWDQFLNYIDKKMYEDKNMYYACEENKRQNPDQAEL